MATNCNNCGHCYIEQVIHVCGRNEGRLPLFDGDGNCKGWKQKHLTNADRIRKMSDKELAKFLCDIVSISDGCYNCVAGKCCEEPFDGSDNGFEQWLMQECE